MTFERNLCVLAYSQECNGVIYLIDKCSRNLIFPSFLRYYLFQAIFFNICKAYLEKNI